MGGPEMAKWIDSCYKAHCKTCKDPAQVEWRKSVAQHFDVPPGFITGSFRCPADDAPAAGPPMADPPPSAPPPVAPPAAPATPTPAAPDPPPSVADPAPVLPTGHPRREPCLPCREKQAELARQRHNRMQAIKGNGGVRNLVLHNADSPGDIVVMTAAIRDLHKAHPGKFTTFIDNPCPQIWENNSYVTQDTGPEPRRIKCEYPAVHQSDRRPRHFIEAYHEFLTEQLNVLIPITEFKPDIHVSDTEKGWINQVEQEFQWKGPFWIMVAGGKMDFTAKWWNPAYAQEVVDYFEGKIKFVQCGEASKGHFHFPLQNVLSLVGKTDLRQFIRLMYHAVGVVCPVTLAMHLAAGVPTKTGRLRPCVVVAGGREPVQWEQYPGHQFLHTVGGLPCCDTRSCWRSRCQKIGDGDPKDSTNTCAAPVDVAEGLQIPKCMNMITPFDVIRAIERYYEGGVLTYG